MTAISAANSDSSKARLYALLWVSFLILSGIALCFFFLDGHHIDAGTHYLYSRWAWKHNDMFVNVWARPLPTFLYAFPAQYGYGLTQILTVIISGITAWQTFRLAQDLKLERSWLAIPFVFIQPSFFLLSNEVMTEPMFALCFVIALRLNQRGWVKMAMLAASLLILIRPEGFFLGAMWGVWVLFDKRVANAFWKRVIASLILASGVLIWSVIAYKITGDFFYIKNNWPQGWQGGVPAFSFKELRLYVIRMPDIVGPIVLPVFLIGLVTAITKREMMNVTSSFLTLFILHSIMRAFGMFGSAGYPRYFVCVAPSIALIILFGWNVLFSNLLMNFPAKFKQGLAGAIIVLSILFCLVYKEGEPWQGDEGATWSRDARAVKETYDWFQANQLPVNRLFWSQAYMGIVFDRDLYEQALFTADREHNLKLLRESPGGTLVFWDGRTGPNWYTLTASDIESAGYKKIYVKEFWLDGSLIKFPVWRFARLRHQEMYLLYKS